MKCTQCGAENQDGFKFCMECGALLPQECLCPACGAANPPGFNFCMECGAVLTAVAGEKSTHRKTARILRTSQGKKPARSRSPREQPSPLPTSTPGSSSSPPPAPPPAAAPAQAAQPAAAPAPVSTPPPTIIIREREKRRSPTVIWILLGVLLSMVLCCGLLWFDVVDVPSGLLARLPDSLARVVGQVLDAIEDRQLDRVWEPIFGGPAPWVREDEKGTGIQGAGGQTGTGGTGTGIQGQGGDQGTGGSGTGQDQGSGSLSAYACSILAAGDVTDFELPGLSHEGFMEITFPAGVRIYTGTSHEGAFFTFKFPDGSQLVIRRHMTGPAAGCFECGMSGDIEGVACQNVSEGGNRLVCKLNPWAHEETGFITELAPTVESYDCYAYYTIPAACSLDRDWNEITTSIWDAGNGTVGFTFIKDTPFDQEKYEILICTGPDRCWTEHYCEVYAQDNHRIVCLLDDFRDPDGDGKFDIVRINSGSDCWPEFGGLAIPSLSSGPSTSACPSGETYHDGWQYNNGCCTDGCWCQQGGVWGCYQTCGEHCGD